MMIIVMINVASSISPKNNDSKEVKIKINIIGLLNWDAHKNNELDFFLDLSVFFP